MPSRPTICSSDELDRLTYGAHAVLRSGADRVKMSVGIYEVSLRHYVARERVGKTTKTPCCTTMGHLMGKMSGALSPHYSLSIAVTCIGRLTYSANKDMACRLEQWSIPKNTGACSEVIDLMWQCCWLLALVSREPQLQIIPYHFRHNDQTFDDRAQACISSMSGRSKASEKPVNTAREWYTLIQTIELLIRASRSGHRQQLPAS
jgi:hypothetical protein